MSQPLFIQYAYLDLGDDQAVDNFWEALKETKNTPSSVLFKERNPKLQKDILRVLSAWHTNSVSKEGIDKWLHKNRPEKIFTALPGKEGDKEIYLYKLEKGDLRGVLIEQIILAMLQGKEIRKCAAEDCQKYFIPTPRGRNQKYCSRQCYERIYSRKRRA